MLDPGQTELKVGDLVWVEVAGELMFKEPRRIEHIDEHDGQKWYRVGGSNTGVLAGELTRADADAPGASEAAAKTADAAPSTVGAVPFMGAQGLREPLRAVSDLRLRLRAGGYDPIACEGKRPPMKAWETKIGINADEVEFWSVSYPQALNSGILCKRTPAIDADLTNPDAAAAVEALAREHFEERGAVLVRIGKAPKRAILLRTDEPFKKMSVNLVAPNGAAEKIEILADGQQVVAFGTHPETLKSYEWFGGSPETVARDELPYVREGDMRGFLDAAAELLVRDFGYQLPPERPKAKAGGGDRGQAGGAADWQYLCDRVRAGLELHDSLRDLAAKLVMSGMAGGAAVNFLRGLMEGSNAPRDGRWQERHDDIPRLVGDAEGKFAPQAGPGAGQGAGTGAPRRKTLRVREPLGRDRRPITERPWEIMKLAMRGELTVIVAPPGAGKTTLTQQVMHAASSGTDFAGFPITRPLKTMVFHWEDDEPEMDRKMQAIEDRMGVTPHPENLLTVYCGAGDDEDDDDLILAHYEAKTDKFTPTLGFDDVDALVARNHPDIIVIDPLANAFEGPEGNELLKRMGRLMRKLARRRNVAVILILHSKKYADAMAGNMDAARNAGTLVGRIRVGLTLFPMTEEEAVQHNITLARRRRFVRLDDGKQSYGSSDDTQWFEIKETILRIDEDRMVSVGIFDPWEPAPLFHNISIPTIHAILRDIDIGVTGPNGAPTGALFQSHKSGEHWAGDIIIKHIPDCPPERAKSILARWKKERLLQTAQFENANRKKRSGLKSNPAKWPGTQT